MVVPADVAQAAREGNFAVVQAYFASGPQRDVDRRRRPPRGVVEGLLPRRAQAAHSPAQLSGSRLRGDD